MSARSYQVKAAETNGLLWDQLEWLYERMAQLLTREIGALFFYDKSLALPGFHIFIDPALSCKGAGKHFDLEHLLIDWGNYPDLDVTDRLSLTVAIHLPDAGAGLWLWDINYLDMEKLSPEAVKMACVHRSQGTLHPYAPGKLYLHSGYQLHQIGASNEFEPGQERLTLQAHALRVRNGYVLYW